MVLNSEKFDKDSFSLKYLDSRKEDWLKQAKNYMIQSLQIFFKSKYNIKTKKATQIAMEVIINSLNVIQIVTLLWYPTMNIRLWKKFGIYWQLFGYFSFDSWISDSRLYFPAFLVIVTFLWTSLIYISIISTLIFRSWKIPKAFIKLPSFLFGFLFSVGYIPSLMILLVTAKYSYLVDPDGTLYSSLSKNNFPLGAFGSILGISSAILLFLLTVIYELFTADVRHSFSNFNIKARSDSNLDIAQLFSKFIVVFIYVFYGYDHFIWHIWFVFVLSLMFSYLTFKFNSYFNPILNAIRITQLLILSGFSFSFLIGIAMDNAGITFIFSICIIPAAGILIFRKILILVENSKESQVSLDQHAFELQIRKFLMDPSTTHSGNIINKFAEIYNTPMFRRDKLLVAWEVYYFLHTLNDIRLAKIKYARMGSVLPSIEGEIQALRIQEWMKKHPGTDQIANNFLVYLIDLEVAKSEDEFLCRYLLEFWYEISSKRSSLNKLENLSNEVYCEIRKVEDRYKKMLHTNHAHVYELYGGLLQNIFQEFNEGANLLHKVYQLKSEEEIMMHENVITKFEEYSGNMVISAQKRNFGIIIYANEIAAQLLKDTVDNMVGNKIDQYIPEPYNEFHAETMKRFVDTCTEPQLGKRDTLFIRDHNGYLSEVKFLIRLTALDESLYYMVSMMACTKNREAALISKEGMIYNHSQDFHRLLNIESSCLIYKYIDNVIPEIVFSKMVLFKPKLIQRKEKVIAVIYCKKDFKSTEIPYILLVQDFYEINAWTKGEAYEQIKYTEQPPILTTSENNFDIKRYSKFLSIESDKHELLRQTNRNLSTLDENASEADSTIIDIIKSNEINSNFLEKTLSSATYSVSSRDNNRNHYLDKGARIILNCQKSLKLFKLVLFLSVYFI
ncbi:unnamed protein product [Blepharisma stoltei]|uniref:TmcB/TmcC TPR repeats domain-containing protein n=1 Tax=Blepharisma stoltei TaxID=1481888 RepID=A0AAU9K3T4_9CILI|nr:unnamed protein product [Blepharisma stoltei]